MAYDPSNPNKYKNQASEYSASVAATKGALESTMSCLNGVSNVLGLDPNNTNDVLSMNVIVGNEEIKAEVEALSADIGKYSGLISTKAKELDEEELQEYLAEQVRNSIKEKEDNNNEETQ